MYYSITYSCGHTGTVDLGGKGADRESKLRWYETSGLCPDCYRAKMQAQQAATPLTLVVDCDPYEQIIILHFSGNTMPAKEQIKALGYGWGELPEMGAWSAMTITKAQLAWQKIITTAEIETEVAKALEIGAKIENHITDADRAAFARQHEKKEKAAAKRAELDAKKAEVIKPQAPAKLAGKKWNQKIYGKAGNYSIYPDSVKTMITDAEAEEIEAYLAAKDAYKKAIAEIENNEE